MNWKNSQWASALNIKEGSSSNDNALIKSKLQHPPPPPRANPRHLNFLRLDHSNLRHLGPNWSSNALPYRRILSVKSPS